MELIKKYFPQTDSQKIEQFRRLITLFGEYNLKVNMISRKDIQNLEERHILHSLSIAKFIDFKPRTRILDLGTGGGFPGLPLAILFPDSQFFLVDSIAKKIQVVQELANELGLTNVEAINQRAEALDLQVDFIVSRAVAPLNDLFRWGRSKIARDNYNDKKNGFILLKGGNLEDEKNDFKKTAGKWIKVKEIPLEKYFDSEFFETKKIIHLPI